MRSGGINWLAVLAAAVAVYAIGFVIYGFLIPEESWMAMSGMTEEQKAVAMRSSPPGFSLAAMRSTGPSLTIRRVECRAFGHGSGCKR